MGTVIAIPQMGTDLFRKYMKSHYTASILRAGGQVKWIELDSPERAVCEALECDGLLLPGGADVEPSLYSAERSEKCGKPNPVRDAAEGLIFPEFLKTGKPILGICRGLQLINVLCGGTLHQDIADIADFSHSNFLKRGRETHRVTVTPESRLYGILGTQSLGVNSLHHQAIDRLGESLAVAAVSSDGIIEAAEMTEHPFCLAVQWHPEFLAKKYQPHRNLFDEFIRHAR